MAEVKTIQEIKAEWERRSKWLKEGKHVATDTIWEMFEPYIVLSESLTAERDRMKLALQKILEANGVDGYTLKDWAAEALKESEGKNG